MTLMIRLTPVRMILAGMGIFVLAGFGGWIVLCSRANGEFKDLSTIQARCSVPSEMRGFVSGMPLRPDSLTCVMQTYSNGAREWRMNIQFPLSDWELWRERYRGFLSTMKDFEAEKYGEDHYRATIRLNRGCSYEFRILLRRFSTDSFITFTCRRSVSESSWFQTWLRRIIHRQAISE